MAKKKNLGAVQSWPNQQHPGEKQLKDYSSKILNAVWQLKKEGYADSTLKAYDSRG